MPRRSLTKPEMDYRLKRLEILAPWGGRCLLVLASTVPAGVTMWGLQTFAGLETDLNISIVASISVAANISMAVAIGRNRKAMNDQSGELNRLRGQQQQWEAQDPAASAVTRKRGGR